MHGVLLPELAIEVLDGLISPLLIYFVAKAVMLLLFWVFRLLFDFDLELIVGFLVLLDGLGDLDACAR